MALLPFLQVAIMDLVISTDPKGLKLAVVNNEISSYQECFNSSLITSLPLNDSCHLEKVSCRFLYEINDLHLSKVFYNSVGEALKNMKKEKFSAIIEFDSNFSQALTLIDSNSENLNDDKLMKSSFINIHMDNADFSIANFVKFHLFSAYKNYTEKLMQSCGLSKNLRNFPMKFQQSFEDANIKDHQFPTLIIQ
jgi:hypothetical protein